jgi:hypothetical protein
MAASNKTAPALPVLNPHAAGIDIGATQILVAVPSKTDASPVRHYATFTADLLALADWLQEFHIKTVAMESTGVYWIPLFQILQDRGLEVYLVNARYLKNVPGHKSDVEDCQWIQYLHACGLLHASFRPEQGDYYRKMRARLGTTAANTAAAHKLARIIYHLLTTGQSYDESVFAKEQERARKSRERKLQRDALALGYRLIPEATDLEPAVT